MATAKIEVQEKHRYRKVREGVVTSNKMDKSVVVAVERKIIHPRFRKYVRVARKVKAHDEKNECQVGDRVQIIETRPLSKDKCWRVQQRLQTASEEGS